MHGISGDLLWNCSFRNTSFFSDEPKSWSAGLASGSNLARLGVWHSQARTRHLHTMSFVLKQAMGPCFVPQAMLEQYLMHWAGAPYAALFWAKSTALFTACFAFRPALRVVAGTVSACFFPQKLVVVRGPCGGVEGDACTVSIHPSLPLSLLRRLLKVVPSFFVLCL